MIALELRNMPEDHDDVDELMQKIIATKYAYYVDDDGHFFCAVDIDLNYLPQIGIQELHGNRAERVFDQIHKLERKNR